MKRVSFLLVILCASVVAFAGDATITGPEYVAPGSQQDYAVSFATPLNSYAHVNWSVTGGTIVTSGNGGCTVLWDNNNTTGSIHAEEDLGGQSGDFSVNVGIAIQPVSFTVIYGVNAGTIQLIGLNPALTYSFQWQSSTDNSNFNDISGQTAYYLDPGPLTVITYFRCNIVQNGQPIMSDVSTAIIQNFSPGSISLTTTPSYSGFPVIGSVAGVGGYCSLLSYTWEMSIENGPWSTIGSGETFPGVPGMIASARFRRKAVCGAEALYTNTITVTPVYTSPWSENLNYVRVNTILIPGVQSWMQADQLPMGQKTQSTIYLDGLGRQMQVVSRAASMATGGPQNDVVQHFEYDRSDRTFRTYLPYPASDPPPPAPSTSGFFKTDAATAQKSFIRTKYGEDATAPTWGSREVEASPLGRPITSQMPGTAWGTNYAGVTNSYNYNATNEILIWTVGYGSGTTDYPVATTYYAAGKLDKVVTTDERGRKVIVFTDDAGRTILKKVQLDDAAAIYEQAYTGWLFTYNVYDDYGRLRFVITPKAYKYLYELGSFSLAANADIADQLCFSYCYDARGRNIIKQTPGQAALYTVYDLDNRPIYSQDGNMRAKNQWLATLYDALSRPTSTGVITYTGTRQQLQDFVGTQFINSGTGLVTIGTSTPADADLYITTREAGRTQYKASNTIVFDGEFSMQSETSPNFIAEILPAGPGNTTTEPLTYSYINNGLPPGHDFKALTVNYYDEYNSSAPAFQPSVTFPATTTPHIQPFAITQRTLSLPTGGKVRVLKNDTYTAGDVFLASTAYYNEDGETIQTLTDNIKTGVDINSVQMDWMGKVIATHEVHNVPGTGYTNFVITNRYEFDGLHRNTSLTKNVNGTDEKLYTIAYNEMGSIAKKTVAPDYHDENNPLSSMANPYGLEQLVYSYNIHGWLTGINKDFALETGTSHTQFQTSFGLYLGYDNRSGQFAKGRLDGKLTGAIWRTQGDNVVRRYNYDYDNMGRFYEADYHQREKPADGTWAKTVKDFSVGFTLYDENGNLLTLRHKSVLFAQTNSSLIDFLSYTYKLIPNTPTTPTSPNGFTSNQLLKVFDNASGTGTMGDFKDAAPGDNSDDYDYDVNGNLTKDNNKHITAGGIKYNLLDKPYEVQLPQVKVAYTYTADGSKLSKTVTPNTPTAANPVKTTWYIGSFIFEEKANTIELQYLYHEEGRIRLIEHKTATTARPTEEIAGGIAMPGGKFGVYDYFIKDQQGNTRMVLTKEQHKRYDYCSMETASAGYEEAEFGNTTNNEVVARQATPHLPDPNDQTADNWSLNTSQYVSKLGGPGNANKIGPNKLLKVMAGDRLDVGVNYYYRNITNSPPSGDIVQSVATLLVNLLGGTTSTSSHGAISPTTFYGSSSYLGMQNFLQNTQPQYTNTAKPKAFINYLFFDENMNFVAYDPATGLGSYSKQVETPGDHLQVLPAFDITVPKNGYAYIYVSNESTLQAVYFDNLAVTHTRRKILEETHYYAHGLKIQAISGQAFQKPTAPDKFQGAYSNYEEETGWNDFELRSYDPQIGRWTGNDPYDEFASGYIGMGNDPINNVDPDGGGTEEDNNVTVYGKAPKGKIPGQAMLGSLVSSLIDAFTYTNASGSGQFVSQHNLGRTAAQVNQSYYRDDVYAQMQVEAEAARAEAVREAILRRIYPDYGRLMGFLEAGHDALLSLAYIFNTDPEENTLVRTGKGLWALGSMNHAERAVMAYNAVANTDFSDPTTQGRLMFHAASLAVPVVGELKAVEAGELLTVGSEGAELVNTSLWPAASEGPTVINGIEYTTHALERMQPVGTIIKGKELFSRGVPPSVVENTIKHGTVTPGSSASAVVRSNENVRVVTNLQGTRVITVIKTGH